MQAKYPQLLTKDEWTTLPTRFHIALKEAAIDKACRKHKDFVLAAVVHRGHKRPNIATTECFAEGTATSVDTCSKAKVLNVPIEVVHYHWSCFLAGEVEVLEFRSNKLEAVAEVASNVAIVGVNPPVDDARVSQEMISRKKKQDQRVFLDMCRSRPDNLPYCVFQEHIETLNASVSQDIKHLTLIDVKGCKYQQLPLTNSHLFEFVQKHAENRSKHGAETEFEYIAAAQQRLHEFAVHPDNAYESIRFLGMKTRDAQEVQAATEKIVENLLKLMGYNELGHVWAEKWHPHRFAAVATYAYIFLADLTDTTSRWNWMVDPKRIYIPIDQI